MWVERCCFVKVVNATSAGEPLIPWFVIFDNFIFLAIL